MTYEYIKRLGTERVDKKILKRCLRRNLHDKRLYVESRGIPRHEKGKNWNGRSLGQDKIQD